MIKDQNMAPEQFFDWQTAGGTEGLAIVSSEQILHGAQLEVRLLTTGRRNPGSLKMWISLSRQNQLTLLQGFSRKPDLDLNVFLGPSVFEAAPKSVFD